MGNILFSVFLTEGKGKNDDYEISTNYNRLDGEGNTWVYVKPKSKEAKKHFYEFHEYRKDQVMGGYETDQSRKSVRNPWREKYEDVKANILYSPAHSLYNRGGIPDEYPDGRFTVYPERDGSARIWYDDEKTGARKSITLTKNDFKEAKKNRFGLEEGLRKLGYKF